MADGALPEPARSVDVLLAVRVPERRAGPAHEDERLGRPSDDRVGMEHVRHVEAGKLGRGDAHSWFLTVFSTVYSSIVCGPCS